MFQEMKKFMMVIAVMVMAICATAQTVEKSDVFDNTEIGIKGGVSALVHPECNGYENLGHTMQATVGVGLTKWITPSVGFGVEGVFGVTNGSQYGAFQSGNWFNYVTVMPQVKVNLNNLIAGYNGEPRVLEVIPTVGFGWIHGFYNSSSAQYSKEGVLREPYNNDKNDLGGKVAIDFRLNMTKRLALTATPYIAYNLTNGRPSQNEFTDPNCQPRFDARNAWYGLEVGVTYRLGKTFKLCPYTYTQDDIDALNDVINKQREELAQKPKEIVKVETVVQKEYVDAGEYVVFFNKASSELTEKAKETLDKIKAEKVSVVRGSASPDGPQKLNKDLSERRAKAVGDYLSGKGVKCELVYGDFGTSNALNSRVVVVVK